MADLVESWEVAGSVGVRDVEELDEGNHQGFHSLYVCYGRELRRFDSAWLDQSMVLLRELGNVVTGRSTRTS